MLRHTYTHVHCTRTDTYIYTSTDTHSQTHTHTHTHKHTCIQGGKREVMYVRNTSTEYYDVSSSEDEGAEVRRRK